MIWRLLVMSLAFSAVLYIALPPMTEALAMDEEEAEHVQAARARSLQESDALRAEEAPAQRARRVHQSAVGLEAAGRQQEALRQYQLAADIVEDAYGEGHPLVDIYRSASETLEVKIETAPL